MRASAYSRTRAASTWLRLALIVFLLGAFALRLHELVRQDIWWDEARNIDVALRPFLQIATAPELDIQPPLFYWLLHVWSALVGAAMGDAPAQLAFLTRLMSVFAGVLGAALLMPLGRRVASATAGALAVMLAALSPFWLAESQEARMYAAGFALLAVAAVLFLDQLRRRGGAAGLFSRPSLLFVLFSAAALLTHYNAIFVLVAWYGWWGVWALLRRDRWRQFSALLAHGLLMALLVLPVVPIALRQIPDYENPNIAIVSAADYLRLNWQAYLGGYAFDPGLLGGAAVYWLWGVLIVASVGLLVQQDLRVGDWRLGDWRRGGLGNKEKPNTADAAPVYNPRSPISQSPNLPLSFTLTWLAGGLALYYVAVLDRNAFNVRYASFVTPALYTLLAAGLAGFGRWWRPLPYLLAVGLAAGLAVTAHADLYDSRFDREHIAEVAEWLHANTQPGDIIFVDQKYPLGFYYTPYAIDAATTLPEGDTAPARYLFVDINTLDKSLNEWAAGADRVFWVQWFESDTDPRRAVHFLLDKYGRHAGEQWFQGYSLDWWEMNPPTTFELAPDMQPVVHQFGQAVQVTEASLPADALTAGEPLPVVLRWQRVPGGAADRPLKARVALYDAAGNRLAQADERLLNDRHRAPDQWQPDDRPLGVYMLTIPEELEPGTYSVRVLVYDAESLEPLPWIDASGNATGLEPELGAVEIRN